MQRFILIFFSLFIFFYSQGQNDPFAPIISEIGALESNKDPKCHATASRLEDFIYGTPLSFDARNARIEFQQRFVQNLWTDYTRLLGEKKKDADVVALFKAAEKNYLQYLDATNGYDVTFRTGAYVWIDGRDFRQYSTIAYALRAILAVQQANIFESESLASLKSDVLGLFKITVDLAVLSVLNEADQMARKENAHEIEARHIQLSARQLFPAMKRFVKTTGNGVPAADNRLLLQDIIDQKLASYESYNQISQAVFLRNIQVYFSKIPWPSSPDASNALRSYYTEAMVGFSVDLLTYAQSLAQKENKTTIEYEDVYAAVQAYLPHTINEFEDVTYYPRLGRQGKVVIEAYDLDAFRDSGLHWQYLKFALEELGEKLRLTPDPFALEMYVEGVAQFAVLLFRVAGGIARDADQETLQIANIEPALRHIQQKLDDHVKTDQQSGETKIISSEQSENIHRAGIFTEQTDASGLTFSHRNSDWLGRLIRSYVIKKEENLARLAIPPAFGGGGVAAEDIDGDGWTDVLLLGGKGNKLLRNKRGKGFEDITETAGLVWQREDRTFGEARQPIIADFDNDGLQDIFITYADDDHRIYRNKGDKTFEDMTEVAKLGGKGFVGGPATAIDFDKDGRLDLYIGYFGNYLAGELPTLKRHNTNGSPNKLFRNLGGFRFQDVSKLSGVQNTGWTQAVGHSDINGDGWQDLIAGNDFGKNAYYVNNRNGSFTDISEEMGTDKASYTMNIGIGDLNRDQRPDFYISNIVVMEKDDKYVLPNEDTQLHFDPSSLETMRVVEANDLFMSATKPDEDLAYFNSKDIGRGYAFTGWSWDADFFDYDNDGDDDLYCLTGMNPYSVYGQENEYYASPEGEAKDVVYAPSNAERNIFFENTNGFLEVAESPGGLDYSGTSRSAAYFDYDNDGDLDIIVNEYQDNAKLFRNESESRGHQWIKIRLAGDPAANTSRDAIGANVLVTTPDGTQQWKEVHSTTGYLSGHPKTLHFGLGTHTSCEVEIRWPDGSIQQLNDLDLNEVHVVRQGD